jgi:hypothetical protein
VLSTVALSSKSQRRQEPAARPLFRHSKRGTGQAWNRASVEQGLRFTLVGAILLPSRLHAGSFSQWLDRSDGLKPVVFVALVVSFVVIILGLQISTPASEAF